MSGRWTSPCLLSWPRVLDHGHFQPAVALDRAQVGVAAVKTPGFEINGRGRVGREYPQARPGRQLAQRALRFLHRLRAHQAAGVENLFRLFHARPMVAVKPGASTLLRCRHAVLLLAAALALSGTAVAGEGLQQRLESLLVESGLAEPHELQPVNVFGDGDPDNGTEDSRIDMASPLWRSPVHDPWNMSGGTLHCDGRNRGSAVIVDTSELAELAQGMVIVTSAHVLYDLGSGRPYRDCRFHYMGLSHLPGYQARVDLDRSRRGSFDPRSERSGPGFGKEDWAVLYVAERPPGVPPGARVPLRAFSSLPPVAERDVQFRFIGWSRSLGVMTISSACRVVESTRADLGGGGWLGHLLDDCDSEGGASGGGLVASVGDGHYLVGIRSGAHWDGAAFPPEQFPLGPPDGASWDVRRNTNFSRAIDAEVLAAVRELVSEVTTIIGTL